jgi:hypothetical protein
VTGISREPRSAQIGRRSHTNHTIVQPNAHRLVGGERETYQLPKRKIKLLEHQPKLASEETKQPRKKWNRNKIANLWVAAGKEVLPSSHHHKICICISHIQIVLEECML